MAGMELLAATAREVTDTAAESSAFSQENFMRIPPIVFSLRWGEDRFLLVIIVVGEKNVEKKDEP